MIKNYENVDKNIIYLKRTKLDFLNFCKANLEFIIDNNVKIISEAYGCGISFIYSFLKKLELDSFREFRNYLWIRYLKTPIDKTKWDENLSDVINEVATHNENLFIEQLSKIDSLIQLIFDSNNQVFFCGLGYSTIGAYDLFGLNMWLPFLNWTWVKERQNVYDFEFLNYNLVNSVFVFFSLSGRSSTNISFLKKIKEQKVDAKVFLITGNNEYNNANIDEAIITANSMKSNDVYTKDVIVSPAYDFILFNNYIKTRALHLYRDTFFSSENFNEEFLWWEKPKKIKKMSF